MPRPRNVDFDWAARELVKEVEAKFAEGHQYAVLPPAVSGAHSVKSRFVVGSRSAEGIHRKAQDLLDANGVYKMRAASKLFMYFRSEIDALYCQSDIDDLVMLTFTNSGGTGKCKFPTNTGSGKCKRLRTSSPSLAAAPASAAQEVTGAVSAESSRSGTTPAVAAAPAVGDSVVTSSDRCSSSSSSTSSSSTSSSSTSSAHRPEIVAESQPGLDPIAGAGSPAGAINTEDTSTNVPTSASAARGVGVCEDAPARAQDGSSTAKTDSCQLTGDATIDALLSLADILEEVEKPRQSTS